MECTALESKYISEEDTKMKHLFSPETNLEIIGALCFDLVHIVGMLRTPKNHSVKTDRVLASL